MFSAGLQAFRCRIGPAAQLYTLAQDELGFLVLRLKMR